MDVEPALSSADGAVVQPSAEAKAVDAAAIASEAVEDLSAGAADVQPTAVDAASETPLAAVPPTPVKLWMVENNQWTDQGTGICECLAGEAKELSRLRITDDGGDVLLDLAVSPGIEYRHEQEKMIVWSDPNGHDYAISFLHEEECIDLLYLSAFVRLATIWSASSMPTPTVRLDIRLSVFMLTAANCKRVCTRWGARSLDTMHVDELDDRVGLHHDGRSLGDDNPVTQELNEDAGPSWSSLPEPSLGTLPNILSLTNSVLAGTDGDRARLTNAVLRQRYVFSLLDLFDQAEDLEDTEALHTIYRIFRNLIMLNEPNLLEVIFQKVLFMRVMGVLEYDPNSPLGRVKHREFLERGNQFHEVVPLPSPDLAERIQKTFRLQYLRDVALPRTIDDGAFATINRTIVTNQIEIVAAISHSEPFLNQLFALLADDTFTAEKPVQAVLFVQELCTMAKAFPPPPRQDLFRALLQHDILDVVTRTLDHADERVLTAAKEILMSVMAFRPTLLRTVLLDQHDLGDATAHSVADGKALGATGAPIPPPSNSLLTAIIRRIHRDPDDGNKAQFAEAIRTILEPDGPPTVVNGKDESVSVMRLVFYGRYRYAHTLFEPLGWPDAEGETLCGVAPGPGRPKQLSLEQAALAECLIELVITFVQRHGFQAKFFVIKNNILPRALQYLHVQPRHVALAALRLLKQVILMEDNMLHNHIVKHKLLASVMVLFEEVRTVNNLTNSALLDLFRIIRAIPTGRELVAYLVSEHRQVLEQSADDLAPCRQLIVRYEQFADSGPASSNAQSDQAERLKRSREERMLDKDEEEYFTEDDDEDVSGNDRGSTEEAGSAEPHSRLLATQEDDDLMPPLSKARRRNGSSDEDDDEDGGLRLKPLLAPAAGARRGMPRGYSRVNLPSGRLTLSRAPEIAPAAGISRPATPIRFVSAGSEASATATSPGGLSALVQYGDDEDAEKPADSAAPSQPTPAENSV